MRLSLVKLDGRFPISDIGSEVSLHHKLYYHGGEHLDATYALRGQLVIV